MNLKPISGNTVGINLWCRKCLKKTPASVCLADLDGKAFEAYYCPECAAELEKAQKGESNDA